MFDEIMEKFEGSPSQQAVIRLLLERGFSVNEDGRVVSGGIEIPNTGIAREIGVDRRVVDSTTDAILDDPELTRIFRNISAIPSLMDLAPVLDLAVLTVGVADADEPGIVAQVTTLIADYDISIRQTISEDPEFTDDPKLYIITDEPLPGDAHVKGVHPVGLVAEHPLAPVQVRQEQRRDADLGPIGRAPGHQRHRDDVARVDPLALGVALLGSLVIALSLEEVISNPLDR